MNPHYSVHTFELTYRLNSEQFHCAKTMIKENGGYPEKAFWAIGQDKWYLSARSCKDAVLQAALAGIRIILTKALIKESGYYSYTLKLIVNPARVVQRIQNEPPDHISLFYASTEAARKAEKQLLYVVGLLISDSDPESYRITRADYCMNCQMKNNKEVNAYLKLIKKSRPPYEIKLIDERDPVTHRSKYPHSVRFESSGFAFVAYSKFDQVASQNQKSDGFFSGEETAAAKGILRIEVQMKAKKLTENPNAATIHTFLQDVESTSKHEMIRILKMLHLDCRYIVQESAWKVLKILTEQRRVSTPACQMLLDCWKEQRRHTAWQSFAQSAQKRNIDLPYCEKLLKSTFGASVLLWPGKTKDSDSWSGFYPSLLERVDHSAVSSPVW